MQRYFGIKKEENQIILEPSDMYHIQKVMRMKPGDNIEVVVENQVWLCQIEPDFQIKILELQPLSSDFMKPITLVIPILKEQKMDFILQKATELGVSEIIPVEMKRSMVKVTDKKDKKQERWNKILKEASEQSMRYQVPKLFPIQTIKDITSLEGLKLICSTREVQNTFKFFLQTHKKYDKLVIVIGPEGGLDPKEESFLIENGFVPVTLGPRILRVETVPIYLLSILNYEYME